ncbi:MAG: hypothetical protein S0880_16405 [Actinomycetota bacterium]|nr:hypothetical protein [Actinomycetota bacterium]
MGRVAEVVALIERYLAEGMTDGLPVIPPTEASLAAAVEASGRDGDDVVGLMPPQYREATVRDVAINAVLAGCLPEYLPVVLAALDAMVQPEFHLEHLATSTKGNAPLLIVNGPVRERIGMNARGNVLGPGNRANATIGRAIRLVMMNLGGAEPGLTDRAVFGHPGKYTYTIAEDEEHSPWEPYHVEVGFEPGDSAVTVVSCEAPRYVGAVTDDPEVIALRMAEVLRTVTSFGFTGPTEAVVLVGGDHRGALGDAGWSKDDLRSAIFGRCGRRAADLRAAAARYPGLDGAGDDDVVPLFRDVGDIKIVAAGGPGIVSLVCYGAPSLDYGLAVTRPIGGDA